MRNLRSNANIEWRRVEELTLYPGNPHTHTTRQLRQIAASIEEFGWTAPIIIDEEGQILAGVGRLEAAKRLGLDAVPTYAAMGLSDAQKCAYVIADNKLTENAGWDLEVLGASFAALQSMDLDFDLDITGFETPEIDLLILGDEVSSEPETAPLPSHGPAISKRGDLWLCGPHQLYCGDALDEASYQTVLGETRAAAVITDPPYNVAIPGHVSGKGAVAHQDFAMASGEMTQGEFEAFLSGVMKHLTAYSRDGSLHFLFMDWRHTEELESAASAHYAEKKNICVWVKSNGGMGSHYRSRHELVYLYKNGRAPHINNVQLGRYGRNRTNVWEYAGVNVFRAGRDQDLADHPTVKPTAMIADAILDSTLRGDLVLDPFAGSGTILLASERTGRHAAAIEIDPKYVDVAIRRFEEATGEDAVLDETKETFADVSARRVRADAAPPLEAAHV